jgi:hypothetical protein
MKNLWLVALLFFLLWVPVFAQNQETFLSSGSAFLRECSVVDKNDLTQLVEAVQKMEAMGCLSFVGGFVVGVEHERMFVKFKTKQDTPSAFCVPEDAESIQMVRIVLKYIRDNPAEAHKPTGVLIMKALRNAYRCSSK